jgi:hypothetical protein
MGRPSGATNKTSRELRAEAKHLIAKADYKDTIAKLKKTQEKKK